ncbi:MAG: dienelactone hydrolase family protein [Rhodospirillales bacterium]|nr:dienelactone hydrolase family protein [Rhodospirillales bacterium]
MQAAKKKVQVPFPDVKSFTGWRSDPAGPAKGGIVVLHAVYGLTDHIGDVCARWADAGYAAVAPALYDRHKPNVVHPYSRAGADAGIESYAALTEDDIFGFIKACVKSLGDVGGVALSGFCTGGTWCWRACAALDLTAQVNFYGSHVPAFIELKPRCPTIMHYGDSDTIVPIGEVERIKSRHPNIDVHVYPGAGHAFFNPEQATHNGAAAALAWQRSLAFMEQHVASKRQAPRL